MPVKDNIKKKKNIFHIIIWILSLCALGLLADLSCIKCGENYIENQFIDATVFGYFIIPCILIVGMFVDEEIPPKSLLAICVLGAIMYLVTAILLFTFLNKSYFGHGHDFDDMKGRTMAAMVLCLLVGLLYLFEFIIALVKPEVLNK